ncbi:killer toxin subunits alpha beta [Fusarium globosum]|uniref:Killer toxin subunits alpha beta n=1 Tax=Fusarium globosum TaxID=78864 RepID=A0A8H5XVJ4_9HYPO|nr:killer toxin subunits alpha beta [Fusarium globosum]
MHKNYPRRIQDTGKIEVPKPKSIIYEAVPKTDELAELLSKSYIDAANEDLGASSEDAVTAFSIPVFMLEDAIESIKKVKEIGEKQKEIKTRELVLSILSIVFAVIPFAGSAASALGGAAMIARAALIIGEAGSAALSIVDIVEDLASAPFAILGMLIGSKDVKVKGPRKAFKDAADARRALKGNKLEAFSPEFRRKDEILQGLLKKSDSCSVP